MNRHIIFVYGTLLSDRGNNHHIVDSRDSEFLGKDTIKGIMYGSGIPFVDVKGDGVIQGELYSINDEVLARLDRIEGYRSDFPERSMYVRVHVKTHKGVDTMVYAIPTHKVHVFKTDRIIPNGDYKAHTASWRY